ncbi:MAG: class I SAM-dependent methyltransferase [Deltaproteobacteria bacterium]|nr:class I SAM-dependent methyltransferase [Deltaproteobacteria bacterium]MBW2066155.1 class I SAM-dependent methyltransferase [Deltaproteobacteria bacterium]
MTGKEKDCVCPVERAGSLDSRIRRWFQNPRKILEPYVTEGMTVLDFGCGPGFFSIDMAYMVGPSGRVIAVDLQEGMLQILRDKILGTELEERITLHRCEELMVNIPREIDFALAFYMIHELPDQRSFFKEIAEALRPQGRLLVVEPPFHVSKEDFEETIQKAQGAGFVLVERPKVLLSKAALLEKSQWNYFVDFS